MIQEHFLDADANKSESSGRTSYVKSAARREAILASALEVFSIHGYHSGSLREIAERVGLSDAGILHHFPTKDALLLATLRYREELTRGRIVDVNRRGLDALEELALVAEDNTARPGIVRMYAISALEASTPGHVAFGYFRDRAEWIVEHLRTAFTEVQADGRLRPDVHPDHAAAMMMAVMDGLQFQWLFAPERVDMADEIRRFVRYLLTPSSAVDPRADLPRSD